jgi:hypothetical protein
MEGKMEDNRYPYTHAADYLREQVCSSEGMSRGAASRIRTAIADVIGMDDEDLAKKLADRFLAEREI